MSTEGTDGQPTAMISKEEAKRAAESTMRTADYGPAGDDVSAEADLVGQKTDEQKPAQSILTVAAGGTIGDATVMDAAERAATAHDDTVSEARPAMTEAVEDSEQTELERHPARTSDVDPRHVDDRAALDAKIRAHLDRGVPKPSADPLIGALIGGRFEVISKLGAGGMGAVYRAKQQGIDRSVAIKVLLQELTSNETLIRRFTIEALAVSRLKHPNTIQIFDFGKTDQGNLYIAMELLEGETLYARHARERRLPVRAALRIVGQVAASLAEAHGKGIIHRDLKPENIFLTRVGDDPDFVKVLDFGVAKLRDGDGDGKGTLTQAGSIFGTPRYMSPEQASARPVDARSDVYALGVILYELIVGHAPFLSDTPLSLLLAHVNDEVPTPSSVCPDVAIPLEVEDLILRLLEKAPGDRIQSAAELSHQCAHLAAILPAAFDRAVDLDEAQALGVALSAPATVHVPMAGLSSDTVVVGGPATAVDAPPDGSRRWLIVALLGLLVGVGAGGAVWMQSRAAGQAGGAADVAPSIDAGSAVAGETADAATSDAGVVDAGPTTVRVQVITVPPGANVLLAGKPGTLLGSTPLPLERKKGTKLLVRLERDGYSPQDLALEFNESTTMKLVLPRLASPDAGAAVKAPPPKRVRPAGRRPRTGRKGSTKPIASKKPTGVGAGKPSVLLPADPVKPKKKKTDGLVGDLM